MHLKTDPIAVLRLLECLLIAPQVLHQLEVMKASTAKDSIGSAVCNRAEQLGATAVVLATHFRKGTISEFFTASVTDYCESHPVYGSTITDA